MRACHNCRMSIPMMTYHGGPRRSRDYELQSVPQMPSSSRLPSMRVTCRVRSRTSSIGRSETTRPPPCTRSRWPGSIAPREAPPTHMPRYSECSATSERPSCPRRAFAHLLNGSRSDRTDWSTRMRSAVHWPMPSHTSALRSEPTVSHPTGDRGRGSRCRQPRGMPRPRRTSESFAWSQAPPRCSIIQ